MAISLKTAGTWAEYTNDGAVVIPGTPAAGDRMFLFATWKDFSITASVSGWTAIGAEFTDGAVASGNGTGSMKVQAWYRDWQSGDSNPTIDFSGAMLGEAVIMLWQKGATESWNDPSAVTAAWPVTAATQTISASSTITVPHNSVVMALLGIRDDSATLTRPTTGIDVASGITWNGNYVESPATHASTTTGNDMSADLGHRFVTTGAAAQTLRVTATIAAVETGAIKWVIQGLGGQSFAQAQAKIISIGKGYSQSMARIGPTTYERILKGIAGLQSFWTLGEPSGSTTIADYKGSITGTVNGTPTFSQASANPLQLEPGIKFDANTKYLTFGDNYDFTGSLPYTIIFWAKHIGAFSATEIIVDKESASGTGYRIGVSSSGGVSSTREGIFGNIGTATADEWGMAVFSYASGGNNARGSFDNTYILNTDGGSLSNVANEFTIARRSYDTTGAFNGVIGSVSVFNTNISNDDIQALYTVANSGAIARPGQAQAKIKVRVESFSQAQAQILAGYALQVKISAPIAWWRLGEASGLPQDLIGTADVDTIAGTPTYGVGHVMNGDNDTAISTTGAASYLRIANNTGLNVGAGPVSVEVWAKRGIVGNVSGYQIFGRGANGYAVGFQANTDKFYFSKQGVGFIATESGTTTDTTDWHHYVATWDGATAHIFKDGVDVTTFIGAQTLTDPTATSYIAGNGGTLGYEGALDELAIYNRILDSTEVNIHYSAALNQAFGQAQALVTGIGKPSGQAAALIAGTYFLPFSDTFTRTVVDGLGTSDNGDTWTLNVGTAANFDINGSSGTAVTISTNQRIDLNNTLIISSQGLEFSGKVAIDKIPSSNSPGFSFIFPNIKNTDTNITQAIGIDIIITSVNTIVLRSIYNGAVSTARTLSYVANDIFNFKLQFIKTSNNEIKISRAFWKEGDPEPVFGIVTTVSDVIFLGGHPSIRIQGSSDANAPFTWTFDDLQIIEAHLTSLAQAQAKIVTAGVTTLQAYAQAQTDIKRTYNTFAQSQARILRIYTTYAQAQAQVKQTYNSFSQVQGSIKTTYRGYAQAQTDIKQIYRSYAQTQANIRQTYNSFAQAQAQILKTYNGFAHTKAAISNPKAFIDTFTRTVSPGIGTSDSGETYTIIAGTPSVNGSALHVLPADSVLAKIGTHSLEKEQLISFDFFIGSDIISTIGITLNKAEGDNNGIDVSNSEGWALAVQNSILFPIVVEAFTWYRVKVWLSNKSNFSQGKFYKVSDPEPDWQVTSTIGVILPPPVNPPSLLIVNTSVDNIYLDNLFIYSFFTPSGQTQAQIKQTYQGYSQAQARIKQTYNVFAQAQGSIKTTYNAFSQAQADIKAVGYGFAQSQADIKQTYQSFAQAQARITKTYNSFAQAQTQIKQTYNSFAQSQADTKQVYKAFTQSQADILVVYQDYGQSQARIKQTYNGFAQSQARILTTYNGYGQAQSNIKQTYNSFAQSQADIKQTYNGYAQAQTSITKSYQGYAQSQTRILAVSNVFAQAQARILTSYVQFAQTQAKINAFNVTAFAQAQGNIKGVDLEGVGQAQAQIKQTYNRFAQAQALTAVGADPVIIQHNEASSATSPVNVVLTNVTAGNTLFLLAANASGATNAMSVSDDKSNTWVRDTFGFLTGSGFTRVEIWRASNAVAGTTTITVSTGSNIQVIALEVSNIILVAPLDVASPTGNGSGNASSTSAPTQPITTTVRDFLVAGLNFSTSGRTSTHVNTGGIWNPLPNAPATNFTGLRGATATANAGTYSDEWTLSTAAPSGSLIAAYKVAISTAITSRGYGQAQASIKPTSNSFAQAQADIRVTSNSFAQTQARIQTSYLAFVQAQGQIKQTYQVYGQSQADIKQVYQGFAQAQSDVLATVNSFAQAQAWIEQTYNGYAQSAAQIKQTYQGYAQAQADIEQTYNGFAQANADIKQVYQSYGQAQARILGYAFAQAQGSIKQTYQGYAQAQAKINAAGVKSYAQAQANIQAGNYGFAQAQAKIKTTRQYAQAQALIVKKYGQAQAQARIKQTYQSYAQAQADIKAIGRGFAQAQASILATVNRFSQAQADIEKTYNTFAQGQARIKQTYQAYAQAQSWIETTNTQFAQAQAAILVTTNRFAQAQALVLHIYQVFAQTQGTIKQIYQAYAQAQASIKSTSTQYGQAQSDIKRIYVSHAQAQAVIILLGRGYAQAQAQIITKISGFAQAQAYILTAGVALAQAQARIRITLQGYAQASSLITRAATVYAQAIAQITRIYTGSGQAQSDILTNVIKSANAQASIVTTVIVSAQAQAIIASKYGYGQASVYIRVDHVLKRMTGTDQVSLRSALQDRLYLSINSSDSSDNIQTNDTSLSITNRDRAGKINSNDTTF